MIKRRYMSDRDRTLSWTKSGYFKGYGKRAGHKLARRQAKRGLLTPPCVTRDAKHLPW